MEQKRPQQTDQQATNAALAALAAAGNAFALGQLWEVNKGFIRRQLWQWYEKNKPVADNAGLSFDDLVQEGYFAVDYAAKHYSPEQGSPSHSATNSSVELFPPGTTSAVFAFCDNSNLVAGFSAANYFAADFSATRSKPVAFHDTHTQHNAPRP